MEVERPYEARAGPNHANNESSKGAKVSRGQSCVQCSQRKVKCDRNKPCANCVKAKVECVIAPPQPRKRRKQKLTERELVERLRRCELLLGQNGIQVETDPRAPDLEVKMGSSPGPGQHDGDQSALLDNESTCSGQNSYAENTPSKVFKIFDDLGRDISDEEYTGSTIHAAYDKAFEHPNGFPFTVDNQACVADLHPSPVHLFQLWQLYLTNINPLLKITHTPSLQARIVEAASDLTNVPKPLEALMFGIYAITVSSLRDEDVLSKFNEEKRNLINKFIPATQQALVNANFMCTSDIMVVQAYFLYLQAVQPYVDPRSMFCLIGIIVRIAHRLGLHRDGAQFGLPPFEAEMRRRVWWQIMILDRRIGEKTGTEITSLSIGGDCKPPLNVNDTELYIDAKQPPKPHAGSTEMIFALSQVELVRSLQAHTDRPSESLPKPSVTPNMAVSRSIGSGGAGPANPNGGPLTQRGIIASLAIQAQGIGVKELGKHLEDTYLQYCDPKIPLHLFTILMIHQALEKRRIVSFICPLIQRPPIMGAASYKQPHPAKDGVRSFRDGVRPKGDGMLANTMPWEHQGRDKESDSPLHAAIRSLDTDTELHNAEVLRGFEWFAWMHVPFPSYMFLMNQLRSLTSGPTCEKAWQAIERNNECRRNLHPPGTGKSPLHLAMGGLILKAWDARVKAARRDGLDEPALPPFLVTIKQTLREAGKLDDGNQKQPGETGKTQHYKPYQVLGSAQLSSGDSDGIGATPGSSTAVNSSMGTSLQGFDPLATLDPDTMLALDSSQFVGGGSLDNDLDGMSLDWTLLMDSFDVDGSGLTFGSWM